MTNQIILSTIYGKNVTGVKTVAKNKGYIYGKGEFVKYGLLLLNRAFDEIK